MNIRLSRHVILVLAVFGGSLICKSVQAGQGENLQGRIIHTPIHSLRENEKLVVEARVDNAPAPVVYMRLYFRSLGEESYRYIEMRQSSTGYIAELSPLNFSPPKLEYFILVLLADQSVITYPDWNPYGEPIVVNIAGKKKETSQTAGYEGTPLAEKLERSGRERTVSTATEVAEDIGEIEPITILSPENGETFDFGEEVVIAASFMSLPNDSVDIESVNLFVDGINVTLNAEIDQYVITYTTSRLRPGKHQVLIQGYLASGQLIPTVRWHFFVKGREGGAATEVTLNGRVFAETRQENISRIGFTANNLGGDMSVKYGVIRTDAHVFLTSRESSRFQPRNRYTFNVELPLLGVTFGDTYPYFNELMLWGKRVRGIYGRLHFGFINFDVVHGQTNRKVAPEFDPTTNAITRFGTHEQNLLGLRTSFGSGKHFQLGFNLVKVRNDVNSLNPGESSETPKDNLVVGSDLLIALDNRRIELKASAAFSLLTNDITNGPLSKQKIEEQFDVNLPFDPADFKDWIIINSSTVPLDPRDLTSLAWLVRFRMNYFNNILNVGFKSLGSQYNSLGNTFLRTDLRGFFFQDRFRLFKNRVFVNLGFERYIDNFDQNNQSPATALSTFIYGISIFPGSRYPSLSVNVRNHNRDNDIEQLIIEQTVSGQVTKDLREDNTTRDIAVQFNYDINLFQLEHSITIGYILSDRTDRFGSTRLTGPNLSDVNSNIQTFNLRTRYRFPLTTNFTFARNDNSFAKGLNNFKFNMYGIRFEYQFLHRKLQTYFGTNVTSASGTTVFLGTTNQAITDYTRTAFNLGLRFDISSKHFILIDGHIIRFNDNGGTFDTSTQSFISRNPSFTDRLLRIYLESRL